MLPTIPKMDHGVTATTTEDTRISGISKVPRQDHREDSASAELELWVRATLQILLNRESTAQL